ncbi:MAG TPA: sugar porter family MFS transporter [Dysgonamonadaceae bacterium]|nr:sugar porter family MFS transporter [Dysgonamonadaceae bacterium]
MNKTNNIGYVAFLSIVAALGGFLFGYDTAVISGTISRVAGQFELDSLQSGWYVGSALVGSIMGVMAAGAMSDKFGRKMTMLISATLFSISAIGCALSGSWDQLVIFRIIGGIGIGIVSIVCPLYISEVSVASHRGRMVSLYQLAITIGFLGAYLMNYYLLNLSHTFSSSSALLTQILGTEEWRGMLGMEAIPAVIFFMIIFLIPESPRWLITKGRETSARKTFDLIYRDSAAVDFHINETKQMLQSKEKANWKLLFKPGTFRIVLIGAAIAILGQFMGVNAVLYYGPTIFESSGLSSGDSLFYQSLIGMVNMGTTILALLIIDKVGRKKLVYFGVSGMIVSLIAIGTYFLKGEAWGISNTFLLIFFLAYMFFTAGSISAVIFVFLSEMYPTKIRGLAMSVAGLSLWVGTYLIGQLTPWMLENLTSAGTFFLFAAMCIPYMLIVWKLMPETAGKTLEDIERFWLKQKTILK